MGRKSWTSRLTVEQCLSLIVELFRRAGTLSSPAGTTGTLTWTNSMTGAELGRIEYALQENENGLAIRICSAAKLIEELTIPLTTTPCHFGGKRFWFRCPFVSDGKSCGRRVGRLYLPPGARVFGCRHCHNLTYQSAQTHDPRPYKLAQNAGAMTAALHSGNLRQVLLGSRALRLRHAWIQKKRWSRLARIVG